MTGAPVGVSRQPSGFRIALVLGGACLVAWVLVVAVIVLLGWEIFLLLFFLLGALAYARSVYERVTADEADQVERDTAAERRRAEEHNQLEKLKGIQRRNRMIS